MAFLVHERMTIYFVKSHIIVWRVISSTIDFNNHLCLSPAELGGAGGEEVRGPPVWSPPLRVESEASSDNSLTTNDMLGADNNI